MFGSTLLFFKLVVVNFLQKRDGAQAAQANQKVFVQSPVVDFLQSGTNDALCPTRPLHLARVAQINVRNPSPGDLAGYLKS